MNSAQGVWGRERLRLTLGCLLVVSQFSLDSLGIAPALPAVVHDLDGVPLFGWAFSAFMLAWLVGTAGSGLLCDTRGPRIPMALGLAGFASGLLLAGISTGMPLFLAGRALQGAGGGAMIGAAYVVVARAYPDELRARVMALMASAWILPALAGPALSGALAEWLGWRAVFASLTPLTLLTAAIILPPLRVLDARGQATDLSPLVWSLRAAAGAGLVLAAVGLLTEPSVALPLFAVGGVLFVPALRALLPAGTFRARPGLPAGLATRALLCFSFYGTEAFIPLAVGELFDVDLAAAGLALSTSALGWIAAAWVLDHVEAGSDGRRRRAAVLVGFALLVVGIAIVAGALLWSLPLVAVLLGWGIGGGGVGLAYTAGNLLYYAEVAPGREGEASSQLQIVEALASAVGTGLGGALLALCTARGIARSGTHVSVFMVTLGVAGLGGALAWRRLHSARQGSS